MTRYIPVAAWQNDTAAGPKTHWSGEESTLYYTSVDSVLFRRSLPIGASQPALLVVFETPEDMARWLDDAQITPESSPHYVRATAEKRP